MDLGHQASLIRPYRAKARKELRRMLPELLRAFSKYRMLIYAVMLILMMLLGNNPMVRSMLQKIIPRRKNREQEEGGVRA